MKFRPRNQTNAARSFELCAAIRTAANVKSHFEDKNEDGFVDPVSEVLQSSQYFRFDIAASRTDKNNVACNSDSLLISFIVIMDDLPTIDAVEMNIIGGNIMLENGALQSIEDAIYSSNNWRVGQSGKDVCPAVLSRINPQTAIGLTVPQICYLGIVLVAGLTYFKSRKASKIRFVYFVLNTADFRSLTRINSGS